MHKQLLSQPLATLRDIILASSIKLGFMPWLTWLIRSYAQEKTLGLTHQTPSSATSEDSTQPGRFQDHGSSSTWYAWFDDNIDDFYTADPSSAPQPLESTDLVNSLLENQITLWHHPEFAPWLIAFAEQAFYQWPAEIPLDADLTQPEQVRSPETQQKLSQAFSTLPRELVNNTHIQELVLMYLGASYPVIEGFSKTPVAQATAKEREHYRQERYAKRTTFYQQHNITAQE
ncbi:hypothetical protein D0962_03950 [Leptolyngbyaceae cyanobacterium CCMR0082]|uniref:Uncharacterized protein n=1 Tax=Adonisia turfae CCMR0082 TaxID=2304604 RepID=A0A6M0S0F3_9CYAN|nr:hypothetical protein [Adonisia turfae]NEZ61935.1 hypothetical protein [Adonisia turfae CCMR0082]